MKENEAQVMEQLKAFRRKYEELVWYARKSQREITTIEELRIAAMEVESKYPEETADLRSHQTGDWSHGFNSGMLASARFVLDALAIGIDEAYESFPNLNS